MMRKDAQNVPPRRLGSMAAALALLVGAACVQTWPALPVPALDLTLASIALLALWCWPRLRWPALCLLAIAWTAWRATLVLDARLPRDLEGRDFDITGVVGGLPETHAGVTTFTFVPQAATLDGHAVVLDGNLRLAWYRAPPDAVDACSRWHLRARLKRPRGLSDPGAFDSERRALERRRMAVGYVRDEVVPTRLGTTAWCVDRWRGELSAAIAARVANPHDAHLLQALAVGDTRDLDTVDWDTARVTGVSHLLAISGFHVGVAAFAGVLLIRFVWWLWPWLALRVPRQMVAAWAAVATGCAYGALAGFSLPTVRTLVMIAVAALAIGSRRAITGPQALALALGAIVVLDPLAVLSAGFWLSFAGVAFLMLGMAPPSRVMEHVRALGSAQWAMTVALLPLSVAFFGQAAPLGAAANLVAVPVVSLLAVPATLAGVLLWPLVPVAAGWCWQMAAWVMHGPWWLLAWLASLPVSTWYLPLPTWWAVAMALVGAVWLLAPRGVPARLLGALLFLPLLMPTRTALPTGAFHADVVDVGQGLSVVVRTAHHALVYDTGARYPSGFDLGQAAVLPTLRALGVRHLDLVMISHGDNDHEGGAPVVVHAYPQARLLGSQPGRSPLPMARCHAGQHWRWDGVDIHVVHPSTDWADSDNDGSCVVVVRGVGGRLLLTGDISQRVEPVVAAAVQDGPPLVLLVPHHGSKSASSEGFLTALQPQLAIVSAGWKNQYHHPAPAVVARYRALGVTLLDTATSGAVGIDFPAQSAPRVRWRWRLRAGRYWRE